MKHSICKFSSFKGRRLIVNHNQIYIKRINSSSCIELEEQKKMSKTRFNPNNTYRPLTNFSIESIIGPIGNDDKTITKRNTLHVTKEESKTSFLNNFKSQEKVREDYNNNSDTMLAVVKKYRPKNFQCPACKMAFSNNGQLKNHVRIHTGERPFKCNYLDCNKTFTRNEELTRHKLIHTGVRPHCCNSCGKRFGRKDHLKKHIRTHDRRKYKRKTNSFNQVKKSTPKSGMLDNNIKTTTSQKIDDDNFFVPSINGKLSPIATIVQANCFKPQHQSASKKMLNNHANVIPVPQTNNQYHSQYHSNLNLHNNLETINCSPSVIIEESSNKYSNPMLTTTTNAIQQFANNYWTKWYNLIGLCQQQQHFMTIPPAIVETPINPSTQLDLYQRKL